MSYVQDPSNFITFVKLLIQRGEVLKILILLTLFLTQTTSLMATENAGVHQRLFNILKAVHEQHIGPVSCDAATSECNLNLDSLQCLRSNRCDLSFVNEEGKTTEVSLPKTKQYYLSLYIIVRKAFAVKVGDFRKFGSRFRPHFKLESPMHCSENLLSKEIFCN